jgi:hypothetical protein
MRRRDFIDLLGGAGVAARGKRAAGRTDVAYGSPAALDEAAQKQITRSVVKGGPS